MKFKLVVNDVEMENGSAQKVMNAVLNCMKASRGELFNIKVYYLTSAGEWKLENVAQVATSER